MSDPIPGRHDYWEKLEDAQLDAMTIVEHIQADADDWDVLAIDVAGIDEDEEILHALVIRRKVRDGSLLIGERYYRFDLAAGVGQWSRNGINRQVTGALPNALRVLYAALADGNLDPEDPMLIDSSEGVVDFDPDVLERAAREFREDELEDSESATEDENDDAVAECVDCGGDVRVGEAIKISMGGATMHRHRGDCGE